MNMNETLVNVVRTKVCKISADEDSKKAGIHKTLYLEIDYSGLSVEQLLEKCVRNDVIAWANGSQGRAKYASHVEKSTIKIKASAPAAAPQATAEELMVREAAAKGITMEALLMEKLAALQSK